MFINQVKKEALSVTSRDVHGTKKNFLVPVKDLYGVSLKQTLKYCSTAHFVEKCFLFQPMYFKICHKSLLRIN